MNMQIEILNPEAKVILDQLVKLNLIRITEQENSKLFSNLLTKIRGDSEIEMDIKDITKEVESVRSKRFDTDQKSD